MIRKLRIKFVAINMLIVFLMLGAILATVLVITGRNLRADSMSFLRELASDPYISLSPTDTGESVRLPFLIVELRSGGEISITNVGYYDLDDAEALRAITTSCMTASGSSGFLREYKLRYYKVATPSYLRIIYVDVSSEMSTMSSMVRHSLIIGAAALLAFFVISLALSYWATRPVEQAWGQQRRFVSDASHELKTPLTLISVSAELMAEREACHEPPLGDMLNGIQHGVVTMRGLVEELLEQARVDNGLSRRQFTEIDMTRLVELCAMSFEALFLDKNMTLSTRLDPGVRLRGSAVHLERLLSILLDNACKYGDEGGTVGVTLSGGRHGCLLCVKNSGTPIGKENLRRIFERFYRQDEARASNGSYGLGLSIAEGIVREHRGSIWAESSGGENRFFVRLPS